MQFYFVKDTHNRQCNNVTIASALSNKYKCVTGKTISTSAEYENVVRVAQNRDAWKLIVQLVVAKHIELHEAKVLRKTERRKEAKKKRAA